VFYQRPPHAAQGNILLTASSILRLTDKTRHGMFYQRPLRREKICGFIIRFVHSESRKQFIGLSTLFSVWKYVDLSIIRFVHSESRKQLIDFEDYAVSCGISCIHHKEIRDMKFYNFN